MHHMGTLRCLVGDVRLKDATNDDECWCITADLQMLNNGCIQMHFCDMNGGGLQSRLHPVATVLAEAAAGGSRRQ